MSEQQERIFISSMEEQHPLLQEMPEQFRKLWFQSFQLTDTKEYLYLQMERIYNNNQFVDLLTFEIADVELLTEWEEEFPNKPFVAIDPSIIFFDGIDNQSRGMFSIGDLDTKTMNFDPELEVYVTATSCGLLIDYGDNTIENWIKI